MSAPLDLGDRLADVEHRLAALEDRADLKEWHVYAITADYDDDCEFPFYIGITINPEQRYRAHHTDRAGPAYSKIRDYEAKGVDCTMVTLARFKSYAEALLFETLQIALRGGLENRDIAECRKKLKLPTIFWKWIDMEADDMRLMLSSDYEG